MVIFESRRNDLLKKVLVSFFAICFVVSRVIRINYAGENESKSGLTLYILIFAVVMIVFLILIVALLNEKIIFRDEGIKLAKGYKSVLVQYDAIRDFYISNHNEMILRTDGEDVVIDVSNFEQVEEIKKELANRIRS